MMQQLPVGVGTHMDNQDKVGIRLCLLHQRRKSPLEIAWESQLRLEKRIVALF